MNPIDNLPALVMQILMGIGLAAACGLRAFLPMFAMGVLERTGYVTLGDHFHWLGSMPALIVFGTAVVVELLADKFPGVDHALDSAGLVVKPLAGALLASAAIVKMDPLLAAVLGIIVGGATAGGVHVTKAGARLLSTTVTAGIGNPILSILEDIAVALLIAVAVLAPILVVVFLGGLGYGGYRLQRRLRRKAAPTTA